MRDGFSPHTGAQNRRQLFILTENLLVRERCRQRCWIPTHTHSEQVPPHLSLFLRVLHLGSCGCSVSCTCPCTYITNTANHSHLHQRPPTHIWAHWAVSFTHTKQQVSTNEFVSPHTEPHPCSTWTGWCLHQLKSTSVKCWRLTLMLWLK